MLLLSPVESPPSGATAPPLWRWAQSTDGLTLAGQGLGPLAECPADAECVLVLPAQRVSWHAVTLPKVGASRLRATLDGLLEDRLLDELATLHLALPPGVKPGSATPIWVLACHKPWLHTCLQALEEAGYPIHRIVPAAAPAATLADASLVVDTGSGTPWWLAATPHGVMALPETAHPALHAWLHAVGAVPADLSAAADAAGLAQAESLWPHTPWALAPAAQQWLHHVRAGWNLAQFDLQLSAPHRRTLRWRQALREWWHEPAWRPMRWGVLGLGLIQLVGLNTLAWQERQHLRAQQAELRQLLTQTFPHVTLVLDAPRQMQQELDGLRLSQGEIGAHDLETLLHTQGQSGAATPQRLEWSRGQATLNGAPP